MKKPILENSSLQAVKNQIGATDTLFLCARLDSIDWKKKVSKNIQNCDLQRILKGPLSATRIPLSACDFQIDPTTCDHSRAP